MEKTQMQFNTGENECFTDLKIWKLVRVVKLTKS